MKLWFHWWNVVKQFRVACSRNRTFLWLGVCLMGMTIRPDMLGVTSIVRALGIMEMYYDRILDFFHSPALSLNKITFIWIRIVTSLFPLFKYNGKIILVGDGLKIPKSGRKMPSVKKLFQESESNTKPQYIFGHSCQAIGVLAGCGKSIFAVPLISRIHEGVVLSNRNKKSLIDKMVAMLQNVTIQCPYYFVADAYYAARQVISGTIKKGNHLISRVRMNAVAYYQAPQSKRRHRGAPRKYGKKIKLRNLFKNQRKMYHAYSPVYDEKKVTIHFTYRDLMWKRAGVIVRFVAVSHPKKGNIILMSTDTSLAPLDIIKLYGLRFKIEVSFKQALRTIGAYSYHFWMAEMTPRPRTSGNQHLHRKTKTYRDKVFRKISAYHRFIQIGLIAQGLLQYLSMCHTKLVWKSFGSWLRTIRPEVLPSEMVTAMAMKNTFVDFFVATGNSLNITKFIRKIIDLQRTEGTRLVA